MEIAPDAHDSRRPTKSGRRFGDPLPWAERPNGRHCVRSMSVDQRQNRRRSHQGGGNQIPPFEKSSCHRQYLIIDGAGVIRRNRLTEFLPRFAGLPRIPTPKDTV